VANTAELAKLSEQFSHGEARLSERDSSIAELERLLAESRRSGKR
jgi:hypothetical protein